MSKINYDNWYVNDHSLSISLSDYYIEIKILYIDENIVYDLRVYHNNKCKLTIPFYSLEEAISFTENIVSKCETPAEILNTYRGLLEQNKIKAKRKK